MMFSDRSPGGRLVERRLTPLFAILLSLASLIAGGLAWQTWRTANAHRSAAERVLADYAAFAAWSYATRVSSATFFAINPVFGGADRVPPQVDAVLRGLRTAADSLERCRCGTDLQPEMMFLIDLRNGFAASLLRDSSLGRSVADERVARIRARAAASLVRGAPAQSPGRIPYRWVADTTRGIDWVAFYSTQFRSPGDPGVIVGFESRASSYVAAVLAPAHRYSPVLPRSLVGSTPMDSILSVSVRSSSGSAIYSGGGPFPGVISTSEPLGAPDTVLTAVVGVNPAAASQLIIGGVPASPLRTILPLVSLAVVLLGIAFVIARRRETMALELRARLSEAHLGALRRQLQPHFLYNVLNSIAMLARRGDNKAVVSVLNQLGDLLRAVLDESPAELIPLRAEIAFIEKYLALEKVRFQDRLQVLVDVPYELGDQRVPAFILQPLVENALRHGIGAVESGGTVTVRARQEGSYLVLDVADTGRGCGEAAIVEGIGLRNTRARLAEIYGEAATLETTSETTGFRSTVRFRTTAEGL